MFSGLKVKLAQGCHSSIHLLLYFTSCLLVLSPLFFPFSLHPSPFLPSISLTAFFSPLPLTSAQSSLALFILPFFLFSPSLLSLYLPHLSSLHLLSSLLVTLLSLPASIFHPFLHFSLSSSPSFFSHDFISSSLFSTLYLPFHYLSSSSFLPLFPFIYLASLPFFFPSSLPSLLSFMVESPKIFLFKTDSRIHIGFFLLLFIRSLQAMILLQSLLLAFCLRIIPGWSM